MPVAGELEVVFEDKNNGVSLLFGKVYYGGM